MHHLNLHDFVKHPDLNGSAHNVKEGGWFKGTSLAHHKPGFFNSHLAGTFHHVAGAPDLSLPSDHVAVLRLLP